MILDIFFEAKSEELKRVVYLGNIEIEEASIQKLTKKEKEAFIEATILTSISKQLEWTPVSGEELEESISHDHTLN